MLIKKLTAALPAGILALALVACSADMETPGDGASGEIRLAPSQSSRAVVSSIDAIDELPVWGFRTEGGSWSDVFRQTPVTLTKEEGAWSYGQKEYWMANNRYLFHAVWPATATVEPDRTTGAIRIEQFDATNHIDLLYAGQSRDYDTEGGGPVSLNLHHLLTQVTFVGKAEAALAEDAIQVKLTSAKLHGTARTGDWSSLSGVWTTAAGEAEIGRTGEFTLDKEGLDLFADETASGGEDNQLLTFPLGNLAEVYFEITFHYDGNVSDALKIPRTQYVQLGSVINGATAWEAGRNYRYTFTIGRNDYIFFAAPAVEAWKENEIGGDSAIDQQNGGN